jgi:hypothetical protein
VERRALGERYGQVTVLRHVPRDREATGTFVFFRGGPLGRTRPGLDAETRIAFSLGAVVVTTEVSGAGTTATDAWSRLRSQGVEALARDARLLELEFADTERYPRPLVLAGSSFGALPVRMLLQRGRLQPSGVLLTAPMTAYVSPYEISPPTGADPEPIQRYWTRSTHFHERAFGFQHTGTSALRRWIDAFDPCIFPEQTLVITSPTDRRSAWPRSICYRGAVLDVAGAHDLLHLSPEFRSGVESFLGVQFARAS